MKITMLCLLGIMVILTIRSVTLTGSSEGLRFFLVPDLSVWPKRYRKCDLWSYESGLLYVEYRNGRYGHLRQLLG